MELLFRRHVLKMKKTGFTLIELIIVVTVVLTLSLIAIPNFNKSKQRVLQKEAVATIKLVAAAERIYKMENSSYVACDCNDATDCVGATGCNPLLRLMLNPTNWKYTANSPSGNITAVSQTTTGMNCTYTMSPLSLPAGYDNEPVKSGANCP